MDEQTRVLIEVRLARAREDIETARMRSSGLWEKEKLKPAAMLTFWWRLKVTRAYLTL
jgi:hypothetical protein